MIESVAGGLRGGIVLLSLLLRPRLRVTLRLRGKSVVLGDKKKKKEL